MFRRHWSGLPEEAFFPADLKGLGYFINDEDEVRSIEDPDLYFKYFLDHNDRINQRQRFMFDQALEREVLARLERLGLSTVRLPLGAGAEERHVPILASADVATRSRVVVVLGEPSQDLGFLAKRVVGGRGGIDKGSMVSVVRALRAQASSAADAAPPAVVVANPGQLYWWPEGGRALSVVASVAVPLPSLVHRGRRHARALNAVPRSEDPARHVGYVCRDVVAALARPDALISVVAVGESCELVTRFLDDADNWAAWRGRLSAMVLLGDVYPDDGLVNPELKQFLASRTRAYAVSGLPLDQPLAPPAGNPSQGIPNLGCPCYASSEPFYTELVLVRALAPALEYLHVAATTPGFENPPIVVTEKPEPEELAEDDWDKVPEAEKPSVSVAPHVLEVA